VTRTVRIGAITLLLIGALLVCTACTKPKPRVVEKATAIPTEEVAPPTPQPTPEETVISVRETSIPAATPTSEVPVAPLAPFFTATPTTAPTVVPTSPATEAPVPTPEVAAPAPPEVPNTHVVQQGETLFSIGERYGIPWLDIARANEIGSPYWIVVGEKLTIPQEGEAVPAAPAEERTHIVQQGENLFRIGLKYGMAWQDIARANGISDPTQVYVGQKLVIP
jgi:LysM repeat protein